MRSVLEVIPVRFLALATKAQGILARTISVRSPRKQALLLCYSHNLAEVERTAKWHPPIFPGRTDLGTTRLHSCSEVVSAR